jgi:hypothetical protein
MGRLISQYETKTPAQNLAARGGLASGGTSPPTGGGGSAYFDIILKLIPAEVVTLYTFVLKLVPSVTVSQQDGGDASGSIHLQCILAWVLFGVGLFLTPFILYFQSEAPQSSDWVRARNIRILLATLAFPFWAYATSGEKLCGILYNNALSLILVAVYAVIAGAIARVTAPKSA